MASLARRCSSRCSPTIASSVSSVMPRPGPDRREAHARVERARLRAAELELERRPPARRLAGQEVGELDPQRRRERVERRELRLALAVLDEGELAAGEADRVAQLVERQAALAAEVADAVAEGREVGSAGFHRLRIAKDHTILNVDFGRTDAAIWRILEVRTRSGRRSGTHERDDDDDLRVLDRNLRLRRIRARAARHHRPRPARLGRRDRGADQARRDRLVRRIQARGRPPHQAARGRGQARRSSTPSGARTATSPAPTPATSPASRIARSSARPTRRTPARRTTGATRARCAPSSSTSSTGR